MLLWDALGEELFSFVCGEVRRFNFYVFSGAGRANTMESPSLSGVRVSA